MGGRVKGEEEDTLTLLKDLAVGNEINLVSNPFPKAHSSITKKLVNR